MEFEKKVSGYDNIPDNYAIEKELTVTITLNEYRNLVFNNAVYKQRCYALEREIQKIERQNGMEKEVK